MVSRQTLLTIPAAILLLIITEFMPTANAQMPVSLAGSWRFQLDRNDTGIAERWFERSLPDKVQLPGTLSSQGIGDDVTVDTKWTGGIVDKSWFTAPEYEKYRKPGNVKVPFWLQPDKYYAGAAWYQRDIEIPREWQGKRIVLELERPHWETRVWVGNRLIGSSNALATPHEYDLGALTAGKHQLTIRVDNRRIIDIGENSHSITDHTQGNWNGIAGRIELAATSPVWIDELTVYPHVETRSATIKGRLMNAGGKSGRGKLAVSLGQLKGGRSQVQLPVVKEVAWDSNGASFEAEVALGEGAALWDEFNPVLYQVAASLDGGSQARDFKSVNIGLREIGTQGTQFVLNGRKLFIRGTLECAIFPKTGHPPTDVASWKRIIGVAKAHGLNNFRFHSWCPPEAAFIAADELGFYLHVECSSWPNQSTTLGDGKPVDEWIYQEADRILKHYGNHPSFLFLLSGNEPGGRNSNAFLAKWVDHYRAKDPRRLYSSGAGWPQIQANQFHVTSDPRIQAWGAGLKSRINAVPPETRTDYRLYIQQRAVPVISHEIGQWCVYPNFEEISKYTGYLKPRNFEIFRETLEAHHLADLAPRFLSASGRLQLLCYKEDIESALRTPGMGGFQLLDLHDFPGQGTALVGVLDPFWESKGYVTPEEYSRFCNSTVLLARLSKRVFTMGESLQAEIEVAHFGAEPMKDVVAAWMLVDDSAMVVSSGELPRRDIPVDNGIPLGSVRVELKNLRAPAHYRFAVGFPGTRFENDWDVWLYPARMDATVPQGVDLFEDAGEALFAALEKGSKAVLWVSPQRVKGDPKLGKVELGFSSIFWNTAWTNRQAPHTLGILCDPQHPLFAEFPTDEHSNWQWWYLVSRAGAMILDGLPPELHPTVQVIDDWVTARRLGLVFEARVGQGSVLVCSMDLSGDLEGNPVARQFRHSLLSYVADDRFQPAVEVTSDQLRALFAPR